MCMHAGIEYAFHVIKRLLGYRKVSYFCVAKNETGAKTQSALVNLYIARRRLKVPGISLRLVDETVVKRHRASHQGATSQHA